ncbi:unnamed protein product [Musa textilis]
MKAVLLDIGYRTIGVLCFTVINGVHYLLPCDLKNVNGLAKLENTMLTFMSWGWLHELFLLYSFCEGTFSCLCWQNSLHHQTPHYMDCFSYIVFVKAHFHVYAGKVVCLVRFGII